MGVCSPDICIGALAGGFGGLVAGADTCGGLSWFGSRVLFLFESESRYFFFSWLVVWLYIPLVFFFIGFHLPVCLSFCLSLFVNTLSVIFSHCLFFICLISLSVCSFLSFSPVIISSVHLCLLISFHISVTFLSLFSLSASLSFPSTNPVCRFLIPVPLCYKRNIA